MGVSLFPSTTDIRYAATNAYDKFVGEGIADLRPMPRALIDIGPTRSLYRFAKTDVELGGDPVLLVPPLAAPALCFDLRRGCSLAEHLLDAGRRTYLVDYGSISFNDRTLGMEHWVDEVLPKAVTKVSADADGRGVHLIAWSLGGIFTMLAAAAHRGLPIASVTIIASPIDVTAIPLVAPVRPLVGLANGTPLTMVYRALGNAPRSVVTNVYKLTGIDKYLTKPLVVAANLGDREFLAQIEAVDHFMANMIAYPGRTFGQLFHHLLRANDLSNGRIDLPGGTVELGDLRVPALIVAGGDDGIAPSKAVRKTVDLLSGSPDVRFEICPGGHLGVLTGRGARTTTWHEIDEFLEDHAPLTG